MTYIKVNVNINTSKGGVRMNAIGYIRVSTEAQADDDKYGVEVQRSAITEYAKENGYDIIRWEIDEMSGAKDNRPALDRILYGDVYNPPVEAVIAFKSDRIARDTKLYFYYLYVLEKKGIKLISAKENFDEEGEFSNIYRSLLLFVAEQERKNIAMRTTQGRHAKALTGGYSGGRVPYGYKLENKILVIDEAEAEIVRLVFEKAKNGQSRLSIANDINKMGYRTRKNKEFLHTGIRSILDNEMVYKGYYKYGGMEYVQGQHEPILK